jgi:hypothetical protein
MSDAMITQSFENSCKSGWSYFGGIKAWAARGKSVRVLLSEIKGSLKLPSFRVYHALKHLHKTAFSAN